MENKKKPFISFIVPCYDLPIEMLAECIDSILALPLRRDEREIILVDDGSRQSPAGGLAERMDEITYIRQENQGLSMARNAGIDMAAGDFIQFVDGDDMLIKSGYEECLRMAKSNEYDVILFHPASKRKAGSMKRHKAFRATSGEEYMLKNNQRAVVWGYIFRKDLLGDLRFTPGTLHEDEEFTPQLLLRAKRLCATKAIAYFYRQRPNSITHNANKRNIIKRLNDTERIISHLAQIAQSKEPLARKAMERRVAQLTMDYIYNIIRLAPSGTQLERRLKRLAGNGLFPLPKQHYTATYTLFRTVTGNRSARTLLTKLLKLAHCPACRMPSHP